MREGMSDRYRLVALGNEQLVNALQGLVRRERYVLADLLAHLAELDERRLYLDLGYSSLFAYCTEALGFCRSAAGRRVAVVRVCRKFPEVFARVAKGELRLSVLSVLASHLNAANADGLFEQCTGKSFEQVEELLAARFPKPDVRDSIRRLPIPIRRSNPDVGTAQSELRIKAVSGTASTLLPGADASLLGADASLLGADASLLGAGVIGTAAAGLENAGDNEASLKAPQVQMAAGLEAARVQVAPQRLEPLSAGRFGVRFTADVEFRDLLEEVRALASHGQPQGDLLSVMKRGLETYRRELLKQRFAVGRKPRSVRDRAASAEPAKRSRRVPAEVTRAVYERDGAACTFRAQDGKLCGARAFLELDHIAPWAAGGASEVGNLRVRCWAHNQHAARRFFGARWMRAALARGLRKEDRKSARCGAK
jgi:hypothetical protein